MIMWIRIRMFSLYHLNRMSTSALLLKSSPLWRNQVSATAKLFDGACGVAAWVCSQEYAVSIAVGSVNSYCMWGVGAEHEDGQQVGAEHEKHEKLQDPAAADVTAFWWRWPAWNLPWNLCNEKHHHIVSVVFHLEQRSMESCEDGIFCRSAFSTCKPVFQNTS